MDEIAEIGSGADRHGETIEVSQELVAITQRWMVALGKKQGSILEALFSNTDQVRYVGSDDDEFFSGKILHEGYSQHAEAMPKLQLKNKTIEAFSRGDIGWSIWIGELQFAGKSKGESFPYRFTFIFSLEAGIWKIVHVHVSTTRSNVEVIGNEHFVFQRLVRAAKADGEIFGIDGTATIMFTDVANSTSLAAFVGDRAWSIAISDHFDEVTKIVEDHNGTVVKTLGDGTMSNFTSARAAMQAAIAIQQAVEKDAAEPKFLVRIGMHTGDVVRSEGDFFGSVVNKAARIAAIAEPGSIFVSEVSRNMAEEGSGLHFENLKPVELHGIDGKHSISRLLSAKE